MFLLYILYLLKIDLVYLTRLVHSDWLIMVKYQKHLLNIFITLVLSKIRSSVFQVPEQFKFMNRPPGKKKKHKKHKLQEETDIATGLVYTILYILQLLIFAVFCQLVYTYIDSENTIMSFKSFPLSLSDRYYIYVLVF